VQILTSAWRILYKVPNTVRTVFDFVYFAPVSVDPVGIIVFSSLNAPCLGVSATSPRSRYYLSRVFRGVTIP